MGELDKIQALFDSGEETNIKLGLMLCESLPESEPLLERYRRLYAQYFETSPEQSVGLWEQIRDIVQKEGITLFYGDWVEHVGLLVSLRFLTIWVRTQKQPAEIRIPAEIGRCRKLEGLRIEGYHTKSSQRMPRIGFYAHEALEQLDRLKQLDFFYLRWAASPCKIQHFKHLNQLNISRCALDKPADWMNELASVEVIRLYEVSMASPAFTCARLDGCRTLRELVLRPEQLPDFPAVPTLERLTVFGFDRPVLRIHEVARRFPRLQKLTIEGSFVALDPCEDWPAFRPVEEIWTRGKSWSAYEC